MWNRRRVLGATVIGAVAMTAPSGCGLFDSDPEPIPEPDPLQPILDDALALAEAYDRLAAAQPELAARITPLAADHRAHAAELSRVIGAPAPSSPSSAPTREEDLPGMRTAESRAMKTADASARTAPAARAVLVGSIAACRAAHVEALR
ncbi:hypothetical protein [Actinoplanes sp. NPDC049265]|uniref:hypothetical protein n=1 Tax=Actinoplanes sp. NPDC049265 TaxID=3363902 RepID=UPI00371FF93C